MVIRGYILNDAVKFADPKPYHRTNNNVTISRVQPQL